MGKEDLLHRGKYVQFLVDIVQNSENYKRDEENSSYIMAVDAPWGTGKSFLMNLFDEELKKQKGIKVVKYNAWEHDYCANPLESLFYVMLKDGAINVSADKLEIVFSSIKKIIGGAVEDLANHYIPETKETAKEFLDILKKITAGKFDDKELKLKFCKSFVAEQYLLENIKTFINCSLNETEKTVIIIDELDRCKPLFAVQLLEIVKHLFNIPKLVFVFSLDVKELSCGVRAVYGNDFDATGYLCKFFDYMTQIPQPDLRMFISAHLMLIKNLPNHNVSLSSANEETSFQGALILFIAQLQLALDLSLRDIITVIANYKILFNTLLKNYENIGAHYIYLYFLTLKYKQPLKYADLFTVSGAKKIVAEMQQIFINSEIRNYYFISRALDELLNTEMISVREWVFDYGRKERDKEKHKIHSFSNNGTVNYYISAYQTISERVSSNIFTLNSVLFDVDLKKWEQIKDLTFAQYLQRQLENYNFVQVEK